MAELKTDWRGLAARMRSDLDRADLTGRARRLAEFTVKATLMQGRTRVVIPNRMELCRLLQIGKNHVAEVSAALASARIVQIKEMADGWELLVFPDSSQWEVEWFCSREALSGFLASLNNTPGQCQGELLDPPPNLARTLAEVSATNAASSQNGNRRAASVRAEVPKMGTFAPASLRNLKDFKAPTESAFSLEDLKLKAGSEVEHEAMDAYKQIIGHEVWEGIGREYADGAKWRLRWRAQRGKVQRVFADLLADLSEGKKHKTAGGRAEYIWKQF